MKKTFCMFVLAVIFLPPCFSQNMLMLGGEYGFLKPQSWGAGLGFNYMLFDEYIQNDLTANFGGIRVKDIYIVEQTGEEEPGEASASEIVFGDPTLKFLFYLRNNLYFTFEWQWVGLRVGVFASLGIYGIPDFPSTFDLFLNPGGFMGISIMPKSPVSVTVDLCPGYVMAFRTGKELIKNEAGFSLSLSLNIRLNLDKW
jgi:hypothetical protein